LITNAIAEVSNLLRLAVLDHLLLGTQRFVSLKAKGLGFSQ